MLLSQDLLVGSLHEVCFERDRHLDVDVCVDDVLRNELDLSVVLRVPGQTKVGLAIDSVTYLLYERR